MRRNSIGEDIIRAAHKAYMENQAIARDEVAKEYGISSRTFTERCRLLGLPLEKRRNVRGWYMLPVNERNH